jgi:hypothetical protein
MPASFKTRDGTKVADGDEVTLVLMYDYEEVEATGTVRQFEHVERKYDAEGIAVGKTSENRWELVTDDAHHPAIGFVPENVKTKIGK